MNSPNFWNDQSNGDVIGEINSLKNVIKDVDSLFISAKDLKKIVEEDIDEDTINLVLDEVNNNKEKIEKLELLLLLGGDYDKNNCILEIHSGAGGTEACDCILDGVKRKIISMK